MAEVIMPRKTALGWVMEVPPEMASVMKIEPSSIVLLYPQEGSLETEILPPPRQNCRRILSGCSTNTKLLLRN